MMILMFLDQNEFIPTSSSVITEVTIDSVTMEPVGDMMTLQRQHLLAGDKLIVNSRPLVNDTEITTSFSRLSIGI